MELVETMTKGIKKLIPDLQEKPVIKYKFHVHHRQKLDEKIGLEICGTCGEVWLNDMHAGWCNPKKCSLLKANESEKGT